ncbi:PLP-dependent aminotransferase family protein [Pseudonocardia spinosispora]|uniref:aminotransferase-like domain-containing protein n=1 Tax=Pseudonocardia spinosispora TaxID=103441 RepID=UPI0003FC6C7B|nr:PLP-dependent aminotransferase family protein [Pseudonocardia spinosispora]
MDDYRAIADVIAAQIADGTLRPGDRLPPQRGFARRHRIAASTASRVYSELTRRGLTVGEVGRGTFVRSASPPPEPALAEPARARIDLELNFPVLPEQPTLLARSLEPLLRPDILAGALAPIGVTGTPGARDAAARLLTRDGWAPEPDRILFAGSGRQAIAAAVAALVPVGERLGVEAITYPVLKGIAARLGITLVPIPMDGEGVDPAELRRRGSALRAVYLQPALHNPLGVTMSARRRSEVARVLTDLDLTAIEDLIYGFLHDEPVLAGLAPQHTVLVDSLSKRSAPGLSVGVLAAPVALIDPVASTLRSGTWSAPRFALEAASRLITDGTLATIGLAKRRDARARQELVRDRLAGFAVRADPRAYHCWWELPDPWRADMFVAAAARHGIAVTPGAAFAVSTANAPNAVRLALASPPLDALADALDLLAHLARRTPEDTGVD